MPHAQPPPPPEAAESLRLDDALKLAGVAATGGEAKMLIQGGAVRVNGTVETRRKRRLVEGDVIEVGEESFEIALSDDPDGPEDDEGAAAAGAREADPLPVRAPGAGELEDEGPGNREEDDEDDEDEDDEAEYDAWNGDDDDDGARLDDAELARWAAWVEERVADGDVEGVIIRLGGLHPDALEAVFARLPSDVEETVLDALDEVLERAAADVDDGDRPLQA